MEDIAAAALQLCAERGADTEEVRRKSHIHTSFIPLKTKESVMKIKAAQKSSSSQAEPVRRPAHGTHRKPQHPPARKPAPAAQAGRSEDVQAKRKPSQAPHSSQPAQRKVQQASQAGGQPGGRKRGSGVVQAQKNQQPGRNQGDRSQKHPGTQSRSGGERRKNR
ncbi:hypothetical protein [Methanocella arvoryzae]|uniref:Uncharacterized protein n=1 Tax=Methanocella arvoryzae (strain DSM 22066 / NBRC 105507 / MRE50) TaxID=351160 RepID=Q0W783_METAR|nr:hypothetical protein [Methanocella arvoryzae]CAJ35760.1 hypothetical protein RCIX297 [Methanocella arvoryzae MRE50]